MKYDVFLSYKSEDYKWAEKLKDSLLKRGVFVSPFNDSIQSERRLSAKILKKGILNSKAIAMIVSPESMKSGWIEEEYFRIVSLSGKNEVKIIPCIVGPAKIPGFLSNRKHVDFTENHRFELNVDRLVFPGITGRRIFVESFTHDKVQPDWVKLRKLFKYTLGCPHINRLSSSRMGLTTHYIKRDESNQISSYLYPLIQSTRDYTVILIDMTVHGVKDSVEFILACRNSTDSVLKSIVFVFYHPPDFIKSLDRNYISEYLRKRFSHYYTIEKTDNIIALQQNVRNTWNFVMNDLMRIDRKRL